MDGALVLLHPWTIAVEGSGRNSAGPKRNVHRSGGEANAEKSESVRMHAITQNGPV